ncbi:thiamine-phosphate kinase [Amphibacillus indicireducens]|uniref:Thiamine-monophosphate kinase n=1 Tax=Amphibacillus indicireducens TaxID=1076330 RepID=A0ABP7VSH3_9BACI
MNEFDFIRSIKQSTYRNSTTIKGIGDDAAIFRQPYQDIVTAVDTFVDGIHFSNKTMKPFHVGYRALAANISDMAAMGADPISYLVSIVVPSHYSDQGLAEIYRGLDVIAKEYQLDLIGGDTVTGEQLVLSVTINGAVMRDKVRYRHLMEPGDVIFVTGTIGDSSAGLELLLNEQSDLNGAEYLINRHRMPTPRVKFAKALASIDRIALNDISDGIASEANELAQASNLAIYLEERDLPISNALKQFTRNQQLKYILNGGEDFELIGSVSPCNWQKVKQIAKQTETPVVIIGKVREEGKNNGTVFIKNNNDYNKLRPSGYVHKN